MLAMESIKFVKKKRKKQKEKNAKTHIRIWDIKIVLVVTVSPSKSWLRAVTLETRTICIKIRYSWYISNGFFLAKKMWNKMKLRIQPYSCWSWLVHKLLQTDCVKCLDWLQIYWPMKHSNQLCVLQHQFFSHVESKQLHARSNDP